MNFQMDRRVAFSRETEHPSLYKWSLQELDVEGNQVGRDQIPWHWSLTFIVTELRLSDEIEIGPDLSSDDDDKMAARETQRIGAKLRPGYPWEHRQYSEPSYSMFGTDRKISDFALQVISRDGEGQLEQCTSWGCVSYTSEIDFRDETTDDTVTFYLYVRPETFARYARKIGASEVHQAFLRVSGVAGFYSGWSPGISTDMIKVLTNDREHVVETSDGCDVELPRLGAVQEAALFMHSINDLEPNKAATADEDDGWPDSPEPNAEQQLDEAGGRAAQQLAVLNAHAVSLLSSLRVAAWVIAALLIVILIK